MIPSSDQIASDSRPYSSRMRALSARPQAACTRPPYGREDAHPPVADLVAEALDHDRAVARDDARGLLLLAQELERLRRGQRVEVVVALASVAGVLLDRPAGERADRLAELARAARAASPFQNGTAPGTPGRGRDDHAVARDLLDPPRRRAEQEHLARRAPRRPSPRRARRRGGRPGRLTENRPRSGIVPALVIASARAPLRARIVPATRSHTMRGRSSPNSSRRVAAVEHVEHVLELRARELGVGVRAREQRVQRVDRSTVVLRRRGDRDDLLREHVERVARHDRLLDQALAHALGDDRALEQVGAELREDAALGDLADVVAGAADALQARR